MKILYCWLLLLDQFCFCETHFTTYQRFVADQRAISQSLGGIVAQHCSQILLTRCLSLKIMREREIKKIEEKNTLRPRSTDSCATLFPNITHEMFEFKNNEGKGGKTKNTLRLISTTGSDVRPPGVCSHETPEENK